MRIWVVCAVHYLSRGVCTFHIMPRNEDFSYQIGESPDVEDFESLSVLIREDEYRGVYFIIRSDNLQTGLVR